MMRTSRANSTVGLWAFGLLVVALVGCAPGWYWDPPPLLPTSPEPLVISYPNPMWVAHSGHEMVWETVIDVLDDYFRIGREEPVRQVGNVITEGRVETFPLVGATLLEPWHPDSVGLAERLECTLQSVRRWAVARVVPAEGGYWVEVAVLKELEDCARPEHTTAGAATIRYDDTLVRVVNPVGPQQITKGWVPQGRDVALEQRILGDLHARLGRALVPPAGSGAAPSWGPWPSPISLGVHQPRGQPPLSASSTLISAAATR